MILFEDPLQSPCPNGEPYPMPTPPILPQAHKEAIGSILDEHIVFTRDRAIQIFIIYLF